MISLYKFKNSNIWYLLSGYQLLLCLGAHEPKEKNIIVFNVIGRIRKMRQQEDEITSLIWQA